MTLTDRLRREETPVTPAGVPDAPARRRARRLVALGAVVAVAAGLVATRGPADGGDGQGAALRVATVPVERRTLVEREALDGTLGYAGASDISGQRGGTVTALPDLGSVVDRGQALYEVDGAPVRLLFGERPAWRRLDEAAGDGPDVRQLEENLVALGHADAGSLTVDGDFTSATTAAVERWERAAGLGRDGVVDLGEVVFAPGALRVTAHRVGLGAPVAPGAAVVAASSSERVVTVDLDARRQGLVAEGDAVEVELPDGTRAPATVTNVGTVAESGSSDDESGLGGDGDEEATVEVVVALSDPAASGQLDRAPVEVHVERNRAEQVLAVPVNALLALAEGGYAVEVDEGGVRRLVAVELGLFAEGMVEVSGDGLAEGTAVVVPA